MIISKTPFRISFFGGGTDYPMWFNHEEKGCVLSTSIDKYCYISCRELPPFFEKRHRIVWSKIELVSNFDEITHPVIRKCMNFMGFDEKSGIEIHHQGDLPARSGIGSSSSFIVGMIKSLLALKGRMISNYDLASKAIHFEQNILNDNVGCQDQIAATYGGFNKIEFINNNIFSVNPMTINIFRQKQLENKLMLFFTGTTRIASNIASDVVKNLQKKRQQLNLLLKMVEKAVHLISENDKNLDEFGYMLHESWMYKKELSNLISNNIIDDIYNKALQNGALGGKLLGAGSSGFMLFYVPEEHQIKIKKIFKNLIHVPFKFEYEGSTIIHYLSQ